MFWTISIIIVALIAFSLESVSGKIIFGSIVLGTGLLLLSWITGIGFLITLAKACAVLIVLTTTIALLIAILGN